MTHSRVPELSHSVRTLSLRATAFGATALLFLLFIQPLEAARADQVGLVEEDSVWITLGADAFGLLQAQPDLRFRNQSLVATLREGEVVATQVEAGDISRISEWLHDAFRRCPGFLHHDSRAEALEAVRQGSVQQIGGALPFEIDQPVLVQALETRLGSANILSIIEDLSMDFNNRYYLHPSGRNAAIWIRDLWAGYAAGRPEVTVELVEHDGFQQPSVVLTVPGSSMPDEVVILGGHLDSISPGSGNPNFTAPGADDNASGIATLSEVIRAAMEEGFTPQRTVKFMGYAAEEVGLRGSQAIAESFQGAGANVVAVLQLDMTGFFGSINDIALIGDFTNNDLSAFLGQLIDTYLTDLSWSTAFCGYACSDHAAWHNRGYPAAFSFEANFGEHNSTIHSTSDTVATLGNSAAHAFKFARLASAFMVETSVDVVPPIFVDGFESGNTNAWSLAFP